MANTADTSSVSLEPLRPLLKHISSSWEKLGLPTSLVRYWSIFPTEQVNCVLDDWPAEEPATQGSIHDFKRRCAECLSGWGITGTSMQDKCAQFTEALMLNIVRLSESQDGWEITQRYASEEYFFVWSLPTQITSIQKQWEQFIDMLNQHTVISLDDANAIVGSLLQTQETEAPSGCYKPRNRKSGKMQTKNVRRVNRKRKRRRGKQHRLRAETNQRAIIWWIGFVLRFSGVDYVSYITKYLDLVPSLFLLLDCAQDEFQDMTLQQLQSLPPPTFADGVDFIVQLPTLVASMCRIVSLASGIEKLNAQACVMEFLLQFIEAVRNTKHIHALLYAFSELQLLDCLYYCSSPVFQPLEVMKLAVACMDFSLQNTLGLDMNCGWMAEASMVHMAHAHNAFFQSAFPSVANSMFGNDELRTLELPLVQRFEC